MFKNNHKTYLGYGYNLTAPGKIKKVGLRDSDRKGHLFGFGSTRIGKTRLIELMMEQDIRQGYSLVFFDPKGRIAEDGIIREKYHVHEAPSKDYKRRTELNVLHTDGTLILTHLKLTGGSALTQTYAVKHKKPYLYNNLFAMPVFKASTDITRWIKQHGIEILNVAGSRASKDPKIYDTTLKLLEAVFFLRNIDDNVPELIYRQQELEFKKKYPKILDNAVDKLIADLPLKDKVEIAGMYKDELDSLHPSLGLYIREKFGLWQGGPLLDSCRELSGDKDLHPDDAAIFIMKKLWEKLRETHIIRMV